VTNQEGPRRKELEELGDRLATARPQMSPLELDDVKARVTTAAGRGPQRGKGQPMKSRLATVMAAFALVLGGSGVVWAAAGGIPGKGGSSGSAPNNQYCPPSSNGAGKPKNPPPGNACGQPNPGHSNSHGNGPGNSNSHGNDHAASASQGKGNGKGK
jgi:hypothetical protein